MFFKNRSLIYHSLSYNSSLIYITMWFVLGLIFGFILGFWDTPCTTSLYFCRLNTLSAPGVYITCFIRDKRVYNRRLSAFSERRPLLYMSLVCHTLNAGVLQHLTGETSACRSKPRTTGSLRFGCLKIEDTILTETDWTQEHGNDQANLGFFTVEDFDLNLHLLHYFFFRLFNINRTFQLGISSTYKWQWQCIPLNGISDEQFLHKNNCCNCKVYFIIFI